MSHRGIGTTERSRNVSQSIRNGQPKWGWKVNKEQGNIMKLLINICLTGINDVGNHQSVEILEIFDIKYGSPGGKG